MRFSLRAPVVAAVGLVLGGCGPLHRVDRPDATVVFHNESIDQADVYALGSGGDAMRIGTVFGGRTETLRVPASAMGGSQNVNIVVRIFPGGRVVASGPFGLAPGESMNVTLTGDEKMLSVLPIRGQ